MHRLRLPRDPRLLQILFLGSLLGAGAALRDFSLRPMQAFLTFLAGLSTQALCTRLVAARRGDGSEPVSFPVRHALPSAAITCLSLSLLLRADTFWVHPLAAAIAIGSKFIVRVRGKHLFNPGNLGVIVSLIALPGVWSSPGQWGQDLAFACWFVALGAVVTSRARTLGISWSFLAFYLSLVALRVAWLGQSWAIWRHQLGNGGLLLFAFFMISDPMTIPNHPRGRTLHALLVAALACFWQYHLHRTNGLLWALALLSPAVPIWDRLWTAPKFSWSPSNLKGDSHVDPRTPSRPDRAIAHSRLVRLLARAVPRPAH